jgi:hypothetical protein
MGGRGMTNRAKEQERIDDLYLNLQIDREEWLKQTDIISTDWDSDGPIKKLGTGKK